MGTTALLALEAARAFPGLEGMDLAKEVTTGRPCDYAIAAIREPVETGVPLFGICLGHQLLSLASR